MPPPPCRSLGRHCRALDVTMRVADNTDEVDHDATWLLGHIERMDFGTLIEDKEALWCETTIHVPCKHLELGPDGRTAKCAAHGFKGQVRPPKRTATPVRLGHDRFEIVEKGRRIRQPLPMAPPKRRALPVVPDSNPCATAKCRTSDGTRHAACCRDLQADIKCTKKEVLLEALLKNRKAPYLCKVEREDDSEKLLSVEIISACRFLKEDGLHCDLHGRLRSDGRPAKPLMCSAWPEKRSGLHVGCAFRNTRLRL